MKCKIKIFGSTGLYKTLGEMESNLDGFEIRYRLDGDDCTLSYSQGGLTHKRSGKASMELLFIEGEHTSGYLGEGVHRGEMKIFSEQVKVSSHEHGAKISLRCSSGGEIVELNFLAIRI